MNEDRGTYEIVKLFRLQNGNAVGLKRVVDNYGASGVRITMRRVEVTSVVDTHVCVTDESLDKIAELWADLKALEQQSKQEAVQSTEAKATTWTVALEESPKPKRKKRRS